MWNLKREYWLGILPPFMSLLPQSSCMPPIIWDIMRITCTFFFCYMINTKWTWHYIYFQRHVIKRFCVHRPFFYHWFHWWNHWTATRLRGSTKTLLQEEEANRNHTVRHYWSPVWEWQNKFTTVWTIMENNKVWELNDTSPPTLVWRYREEIQERRFAKPSHSCCPIQEE